MPLVSPASVTPALSRLIVCIVCILISFLAYPSQYYILWPLAHWSTTQKVWFNTLVGCIWITYYRSINADPGTLPTSWIPDGKDELNEPESKDPKDEQTLWGKSAGRWCTKCSAWKPPRCHHCKKCNKCILRMDHHCPWTNNCVGYRNLPHFIRFLFYTTFTCFTLECHLVSFVMEIWDLPSHRGPSIPKLFLLAFLLLFNTFTTFSLLILFIRTIWSAGEGTTTIEYWERERHASLVLRRIVKRVVFPWDIGVWENLVEIMGTWKIWEWFWVFAKDRKVYGDDGRTAGKGWSWERDGGGGVRWEVNGFEDPSTPWPPADPERTPAAFLRHPHNTPNSVSSYLATTTATTNSEYIAAFKRRQEADLKLKRWKRREDGRDSGEEGENSGDGGSEDGKKLGPDGLSWDGGWRNEEGQTLADYGVDEEAEAGFSADIEVQRRVGGKGGYVQVPGYSVGTAGAATGSSHQGYYSRVPAGAEGGGDEEDDDENVSLGELLRRRRRQHEMQGGAAGGVGGNGGNGGEVR